MNLKRKIKEELKEAATGWACCCKWTDTVYGKGECTGGWGCRCDGLGPRELEMNREAKKKERNPRRRDMGKMGEEKIGGGKEKEPCICNEWSQDQDGWYCSKDTPTGCITGTGMTTKEKGTKKLNEGPVCKGGCPENHTCTWHGCKPNFTVDGVDNKVKTYGTNDYKGSMRENRRNIDNFLKEDKPKGKRKGSTPRPSDKAIMNVAKRVLGGGVEPNTGMNNWWCCLMACNNPGCKGDRWEVVMNP